MRKLIKWTFRLILLIILLVVVLIFSFDPVMKAVAENRIRAQTGMDVKIGKLSVGLLSPVVTIEDFRLYNTAEFGGTLFIHIPELRVEYDRAALAYRELHIKLMRFNLSELSVVRNEAGRTNILELMNRPEVAGKQPSGKGDRLQERLGDVKFTGIDVLNLSLGKVRFVDLRAPDRSVELNMNVRDQILKNVKSERDLYGVLFLIWLRNGFTLSGDPMMSPPQLFRFPEVPAQNTPKQTGR
ncbi:MAG TPA: hypothetical protein PKA41_04325 [Verrucomicrobiota bacterium]|nr:hypothetical protein [Verrucomicrobiota bacterium]